MGFIAMITYSLKGKKFRKIIDRLRKLFSEINHKRNGNYLFRPIYILIIIFNLYLIFVAVILTTFFHLRNQAISLKFIPVFIAEFYLQIMHFATDFYLLYFTSYLVILQKLFVNQLRDYNIKSNILSEKELNEIKLKLDSIQSLIDRLSKLLSPLLLFLCGNMFYDLVTCSYFTMESIKHSLYFKKEFMAPNIGLFGNALRLIFICFIAECLVIQVCFELLN